jgi:hypothetical protein
MKKLVLVVAFFVGNFVFANQDFSTKQEQEVINVSMKITQSDCWDIATYIADELYGGDFDVFEDRYTTCLSLIEQ